ncbi:MAG TPA: ATP-dependent helicase C-terminal domain-containing protein, partial [Paracoccaceae bacterium]|nr:ATP-dependent helicase C-terminal domain-containing protein [Paracoccaceae bacterium]
SQGPEAALLAALLQERDPLRGQGADLRERLRAAAGRTDAAADPAALARIRAEATRIARRGAAPAAVADAAPRGHEPKNPAASPSGPARRKPAEPPRLPHPDRAAALAGVLAAEAYPDRIALRRPGREPRYLLSGGRGAVLDAADPLTAERLLVAVDVEDGPEARIRLAAPIAEAELREVLRNRIVRAETVEWSPRMARVEARRRDMLGAIALTDQPWGDAPHERLAAALADGIRARGPAALDWPPAALSLRARLGWLRRQGGALAARLPDWSDEGLAATLENWLVPHLSGERRIEDIRVDLTAALRATLDWDVQQAIDRRAPARIETPLGSAAIDYAREQPTISVRVQEMFGVTRHPTVGDPPVPLLIELLSPAMRPVQTTADLPGFWASSYADVRRDMRARYPRHPWPEDPTTADPTRRAKPRGR